MAQMRRLLRDEKVRRLAIEFGCQWLHIRDFDRLDEKSERHFPTFAPLRGAMYEESIQYLTHLFQDDRPLLDLLDSDHTYLNESLAKHYGVPGVTGAEWRRVEGIQKYARGGMLAQATTLATQSGASRTSPILRGNWISEVLLGERLPRPPKGVPQLPEDEAATEGLTVRQLVEKHSSEQKCAVCHKRIDPLGFSLERFDAIGRRRDKDLGDRPIDLHDGVDPLAEIVVEPAMLCVKPPVTNVPATLKSPLTSKGAVAVSVDVEITDTLALPNTTSGVPPADCAPTRSNVKLPPPPTIPVVV